MLGSRDDSVHVGLLQTDHHGLIDGKFYVRRSGSLVREFEAAAIEAIDRILALGASLIFLPEYAGTPRLWREISELIMETPVAIAAGTQRLRSLKDLEGLGRWLPGGRPTSASVGRNLGVVLVGGTREAAVFEKVSLSTPEVGIVAEGTTVRVMNFKYGTYRKNFRVGILVCHDFLQLELVARCYAAGINLLVVPSFNHTPARFENMRGALCEDYQGVVALVNARERDGAWGETQLWAFQPREICHTPPPEGYEIARVGGFSYLGFAVYPESVYRKVQLSNPFRPLVHRQSVWKLSF